METYSGVDDGVTPETVRTAATRSQVSDGGGLMTATRQEHENWTAAGSDVAAKNTYSSIRRALAEVSQRRDIEVFLQGSYANATNIRNDSDVDIVVMTRQTFQGATERLSPAAQDQYHALPEARFTRDDLRREVTSALVTYYGAGRVHERNKCIKVDKAPGYVDADVVPSLQYRWYRTPGSGLHGDFVEGIAIHPLRGGRIINFPKEHIANGQAKNSVCSGRYKESVRQVKRLRNRAVDEGRLRDGVAPGYLLECMVYNVPTDRFVSDDSDRLSSVILWLKHANRSGFLSCDRIHRLFKTDPGNFSVESAQLIIDALWDAY
ncbi:MAG: nucleotidyltransferase [Actinomycetota bacterium]